MVVTPSSSASPLPSVTFDSVPSIDEVFSSGTLSPQAKVSCKRRDVERNFGYIIVSKIRVGN